MYCLEWESDENEKSNPRNRQCNWSTDASTVCRIVNLSILHNHTSDLMYMHRWVHVYKCACTVGMCIVITTCFQANMSKQRSFCTIGIPCVNSSLYRFKRTSRFCLHCAWGAVTAPWQQSTPVPLLLTPSPASDPAMFSSERTFFSDALEKLGLYHLFTPSFLLLHFCF